MRWCSTRCNEAEADEPTRPREGTCNDQGWGIIPPGPIFIDGQGTFKCKGGRSVGKGFLSMRPSFSPATTSNLQTKGYSPFLFSLPDFSDEVKLFFFTLNSAAAVCKGVLIAYIRRFHVCTAHGGQTDRSSREPSHLALASPHRASC